MRHKIIIFYIMHVYHLQGDNNEPFLHTGDEI